MKHATISISEELYKELERYVASLDDHLELSTVIETALREFLDRDDPLRNMEYRPFRITPVAEKDGSGERDVSINHDKYLADDAYEDAFSRFREKS